MLRAVRARLASFALLLSALAPTVARAGDLAELQQRLRSSEERERRAAVQGLSEAGSAEAWKLVLGALRDPSAMVADEAEIQLARADAALVALLVGKDGLRSGDAGVRLRAAGALGAVGVPVDPAALAVALGDGEAGFRRTVCAGAESLARRSMLAEDKGGKLAAALDRALERDRDPAVRGAALLARAALGGAPAALAQEAAGDQAPEVQCARLLLLAERSAPSELAPFAAHSARAVRSTLVRALAARPSGEAAKLLIDVIAAGGAARPAWDAAAGLEAWSGVRGGLDVELWRGWHARLGPDWTPATGAHAAAPTSSGTAVFYGMPLVSDRVAILVDLSGSMWSARAGGRTRKQAVDAELATTLAALPDSARFNLLPYTSEPIPWEKALVPATPANVKRALEFFAGCKATGKGSFWEAAQAALEGPEVDTLLVLFDGAPTGGRHWNVDLMRERFVEQNRFRAVALDLLVFDAAKGLFARWERCASETGGRALAIEL